MLRKYYVVCYLIIMKLKHAFTEMTITLGWNNAAGNIHELKTLLCINIFIILGRKIIHHTTYEYG